MSLNIRHISMNVAGQTGSPFSTAIASRSAISHESTSTNAASEEQRIIEDACPSDRTVLQDLWSNVFLKTFASYQIYDAIAQQGANETQSYFDEIPTTQIPTDFILDKAKLTDNEIDVRLAVVGRGIFSKESSGGELPPPPNGRSVKEDFENRLNNLRSLTMDVCKPRMDAVWRSRFSRSYGNYTYAGGKTITSPEDLTSAIISEPFDNYMRGMVNHAQNNMWGSGNTWAVKIEKFVMCMLKLEYLQTNCAGRVAKKVHQGKCIKGLLVRMKQTNFVGRFRRDTKRYHHEILYRRSVNVADSKDIVKLRQATIAADGFNGMIGICHGHPSLFHDVARNTLEHAKGWLATQIEAGVAEDEIYEQMRARREADGLVVQTAGNSVVSPLPSPMEASTVGGSSNSSSDPTPMELDDDDSTVDGIDELLAATANTAEAIAIMGEARSASAPPKKKPVPKKQVAKKVAKKVAPKGRKAGPKKKPALTPKKPPKPQAVLALPSTPKKTPQRLMPYPPSPSKKYPCCDLDHNVDLTTWDGSYFTEKYQEATGGTIPTHCSGWCKRQRFVGNDIPMADVDVRTCVKVTTTKTVTICRNAQKPDHSCVFALCFVCRTAMDLLLGGNYKEERDADGEWIIKKNGGDDGGSCRRSHRSHQPRVVIECGEKMVGDSIVPDL